MKWTYKNIENLLKSKGCKLLSIDNKSEKIVKLILKL